MADGGSIGSATCPACGLAVSPGYPKCPKCHARMPAAPSLGADPRLRTVQGGTAVSSGPGPYLWIAVAGVIGVAAVVVFLARGSDGHAEPEQAAPDPEGGDEPAPRPAIAAPDPFPPDVPDEVATARTELVTRRSRAAEAVGAALEGARLWGTVEVVGERLHIHSAYCASIGDEQLAATRSESGAAWFEGVSCFERHGPVAWERSLGSGGAASP